MCLQVKISGRTAYTYGYNKTLSQIYTFTRDFFQYPTKFRYRVGEHSEGMDVSLLGKNYYFVII